MATKKVTITMPFERLDEIGDLVRAGRVASVSDFLRQAVDAMLDDVSDWSAMLDVALDETGGPLTEEEREWADTVLDGQAA